MDMSPGLIGLGIGPRVDAVVWELSGDNDSGAGGSDSEGVVGTASNGTGDDDDDDGGAGMQRVHRLVQAVPALLQAGRVALPGAWERLAPAHAICRPGPSHYFGLLSTIWQTTGH